MIHTLFFVCLIACFALTRTRRRSLGEALAAVVALSSLFAGVLMAVIA